MFLKSAEPRRGLQGFTARGEIVAGGIKAETTQARLPPVSSKALLDTFRKDRGRYKQALSAPKLLNGPLIAPIGA